MATASEDERLKLELEDEEEEVVLCECGVPKEEWHLCGAIAESNREVDFDETRGL